jgi:PadR family transcriptional regulator PadR
VAARRACPLLTSTSEANYDRPVNFMLGTLDVLILTALAGAPLHGYDVVEWIRSVTDGDVAIEDGALYTALHRMEQRGWLAADWRVSPKGRRARYYSLTAEGRRQLRAGQQGWKRFAHAVGKVFAARQRA